MSVKDGQNNLRRIAEILDRKTPLSNEDTKFLSDALNRIADGEDAKKALGVNAKRGERTSKTEQNRIYESGIKKSLVLGWIAAAKASEEESGLELTLEAAIGMIGEHGRFCRVVNQKPKFSRKGTAPLKLDGFSPLAHKIGRRTTSYPHR